jgi:hypothetical protein
MANWKIKAYIFYEIGDSCRTEFLMKNGQFCSTEDAVVIGTSNGQNPQEAFRKLRVSSPWVKEYKIDTVVAREIGEAVYF